jgi:hypothetical protein
VRLTGKLPGGLPGTKTLVTTAFRVAG